jgi:hypothetical protein
MDTAEIARELHYPEGKIATVLAEALAWSKRERERA